MQRMLVVVVSVVVEIKWHYCPVSYGCYNTAQHSLISYDTQQKQATRKKKKAIEGQKVYFRCIIRTYEAYLTYILM